MSKHEQTMEEHVDCNVMVAIDQADEYGGLEGSRSAFLQNTVDSMLEDGYSADEAMEAGDWFFVKFNKKTGLSA